jgi:chromosome segregation ATPase
LLIEVEKLEKSDAHGKSRELEINCLKQELEAVNTASAQTSEALAQVELQISAQSAVLTELTQQHAQLSEQLRKHHSNRDANHQLQVKLGELRAAHARRIKALEQAAPAEISRRVNEKLVQWKQVLSELNTSHDAELAALDAQIAVLEKQLLNEG